MNTVDSKGRRLGRRAVLAAGSAAVAGCVTASPAPANRAEPPPDMAVLPQLPLPAPAVPVVRVAPASPAPLPKPALIDLGVESIVQPFWASEGDRILFYDQPAAGQGGTWRVDPVTGEVARERSQWGSYVARGSLLVTPRPTQRDTHVLHLPSGREWTLPTTNGGTYSPDGAMVTYSAANTQPGQPGGQGTFSTTTLMVSWADGQHATRVPLPINASPVAWIKGADGTPNGRLLLSGRRARQEPTSFWLFNPNDRSLHDLSQTRTRRLVGVHVSPDTEWVAYYAAWNQDQSQNGLWAMKVDGSLRRKLDFKGGYRWTVDGRLIVVPMRASHAESHEVWELELASGELRKLTDGASLPFRILNYDWDVSPDGTNVVFVDAATKRLGNITLPPGMQQERGSVPTAVPPPAPAGGGRPYRLPFEAAPGPDGWYVAHWYGVTTGGYRGRNSAYSQGQGIHFGIDFAAPVGTPMVAVAPGRVLAIDGDYGSPPHNLVLALDDGNHAMYGHVLERSRHVQVGQRVEAGQVVANTGDSSAPYDGFGNPHVHMEIRKRGRDTATNLVPYFDANWDDMTLGSYPGPRFERDLDNPRRNQFPDDQPDIRFGGAIITNFARPWPP